MFADEDAVEEDMVDPKVVAAEMVGNEVRVT
jgi:hypothetical protein